MNKRVKLCGYCDKPDAPGWHYGDQIGTTYGTLKRAQNEAAQDMLELVLAEYRNRGGIALEELRDNLREYLNRNYINEWLVSESCEWLADTKPCRECSKPVDADVWTEELELCLDCSNAYWNHECENTND